MRRARVEDIANQRVSRLSGGQTQRARFAVAVVSNPDLLVLDEPTAAMDVEARQAFWASMREFTAEGRTVVFATHYLDEADSFADRIVIMNHGRIVADGTPAEVKAVVSGRTIGFSLPAAPGEAELDAFRALPGATAAAAALTRVRLSTADSDATLRALLAARSDVRDIEVTSSTMDDAFLALVGEDER